MSTGSSHDAGDESRGGSNGDPDRLLDVLRELKAEGCNLLVVGDAPRRLFTCTSASLLGDTDERRYRLLAATDASPQSIVERLPDPEQTPGSFEQTTEVINHASPPRSITDADGDAVPGLSERRVVDPQLAGLQAEIAEGMAGFDRHAGGLSPAQLRFGVDSLAALFEHYEDDVVRRCLRVVTGYVHDYSAMGHYVLPEPYDTRRVQSLVDEFDAVVELRAVDPVTHGHDAEERWHVPERDLTTDWVAQ